MVHVCQRCGMYAPPEQEARSPLQMQLRRQQAEIERLGRCNEELSRSHAEQRNILEAEIRGLRDALRIAQGQDKVRDSDVDQYS